MALGTAATLALGSVAGGAISAIGAKKAGDAQADAAAQANQTQRYIYDQNVELSAPWRNAGQNALMALQYELGLGERPTFGGTTASSDGAGSATGSGYTADDIEAVQDGGLWMVSGRNFGQYGPLREYFPTEAEALQYAQRQQRIRSGDGEGRAPTPGVSQVGGGVTGYRVGDQTFNTREEAEAFINGQGGGAEGGTEYRGFETSPGYQFRLDEGNKAIERMAAARGLRLSSGTLKDAARFNQGEASQEYGNYYNRLASLAGTGQTAVQNTQRLGQNYASNVGANLRAAGQARASGYQGMANAFGGTINSLGGIAGAASSGMYGPNPGFGITPSPAGLQAWGWS